MIWITWRQYRTELLLVVGMLVALAAYLIPTGLQGHDAFNSSGLASCLSTDPFGCWDLKEPIQNAYDSPQRVTTWFIFFPGILGVILAAPIVFEFDRRTYRLSWTQSISRDRWLWTKLGIALLALSAFAITFTMMMTWWFSPLDRLDPISHHHLESFAFKGAIPLSYAALAFASTLGIGALTKRSIVAALLGLVVFVTAQILIGTALRGSDQTIVIDETTRMVRDRFWEFQLIEAAIVLGVSAVFIALAAWIVKLRMQ